MASVEAELLIVAEHLLRKAKRRIVAPLSHRAQRSIAARFRSQARSVRKAITPLVRDALRDGGDWNDALRRRLLSAASAALDERRPIHGFASVADSAYNRGVAMAAAELDGNATGRVPGPGRVSLDVETELDQTTLDRIEKALRDAYEAQETPRETIAMVGDVFISRVESAPVIAQHEVSRAFHQGQTDAARLISTDVGEDVQKRWDCEPSACDDCLECEAEDWVDIDFEFPTFGVDEPPGHPNCRCGISFRRAKD